MSEMLERARRGLRPSKQATAEGWAPLRARLEDPDDVPELPRVPTTERSWRPWVVAAIAIAAAAALWIAIAPERFVASGAPARQQAPDHVHDPQREPARTQEHVEERPPAAEEQPSEVPAPFATTEPEPSKPRVRPRPPRVEQTDALAAELALLRAAKRALASGNAESALASVREHARQHPDGELVEERWATHVRVLCALDRTQEAARIASQFAAARPASTVARALRDDPCANKE